jgi:hypothetical protein
MVKNKITVKGAENEEIAIETPKKPNSRLPFIALLFSVAPIVLTLFVFFISLYLVDLTWYLSISVILLISNLSMMSGFILGIVSLATKKVRTRKTGMLLSILAIIIPTIPAIFVIAWGIGVSTGLISLM